MWIFKVVITSRLVDWRRGAVKPMCAVCSINWTTQVASARSPTHTRALGRQSFYLFLGTSFVSSTVCVCVAASVCALFPVFWNMCQIRVATATKIRYSLIVFVMLLCCIFCACMFSSIQSGRSAHTNTNMHTHTRTIWPILQLMYSNVINACACSCVHHHQHTDCSRPLVKDVNYGAARLGWWVRLRAPFMCVCVVQRLWWFLGTASSATT